MIGLWIIGCNHTIQIFIQHPLTIGLGILVDIVVIFRSPLKVVSGTHCMVFIELIVNRDCTLQTLAFESLVAQVEVLLPMLVQIGVYHESLVIPTFEITCIQHTGDIQTVLSVIQIQLVVNRPSVISLVTCHRSVVNAYPFACHLFRDDTDDCLDRCIISGTWIGNYFYGFDVVGRQLVQFLGISHFASVDVDFGCTSAEYGYSSVLSGNIRYLVQKILGCSGFFQQGTAYGCYHCITLHLRFRQVSFYGYFSQHLRIGQKLDDS